MRYSALNMTISVFALMETHTQKSIQRERERERENGVLKCLSNRFDGTLKSHDPNVDVR